MSECVLVTGGAGFIGCHVTTALLARGHRVVVLDSLLDQVHGPVASFGSASRDVEFIHGDVRDIAAVKRALARADSVIHLAAEVGVGQSMYAIDRYVSANDLGTATLFQALTERPVRRIVTASSMSLYGEGLYRDAAGVLYPAVIRPARRQPGTGWDPVDANGESLVPVATPESKQPSLMSVYALTKFVQERLTLTLAAAYGMEGVALRLFNAYGPGQALSNPYTGVLAIFASRLANDQPPMVFEDGEQRRDFVHVEDVAAAFVLALEHPAAAGHTFNLGSGRDVSINEVAAEIARAMGRPDLQPVLSGKARSGDIRHCFADIGLARGVLGYEPRRSFDDSLDELVAWVERQQAVDRVDEASRELEVRGLVA